MSRIVLNILWHCLSLGLGWNLTLSSPVATAEFSIFAGILSAALSLHHLFQHLPWNSSTGIPSPPLTLFLVMLPKAHLTSHFRISVYRWVITPSYLPGSWRATHWNIETEFHLWTPVQFSSVQLLSCVQLFASPRTAAHQASLSITNSWSFLKLMSNEMVMPSKHLIPFSSRLQSFPASGSFLMSQFFASGGQSIGVSASTSVLPMNIQDWFPLGLTGWISLQSKELSRVFSNTIVQKHQLFNAQLSL